jgi:hypothetical protein
MTSVNTQLGSLPVTKGTLQQQMLTLTPLGQWGAGRLFDVLPHDPSTAHSAHTTTAHSARTLPEYDSNDTARSLSYPVSVGNTYSHQPAVTGNTEGGHVYAQRSIFLIPTRFLSLYSGSEVQAIEIRLPYEAGGKGTDIISPDSSYSDSELRIYSTRSAGTVCKHVDMDLIKTRATLASAPMSYTGSPEHDIVQSNVFVQAARATENDWPIEDSQRLYRITVPSRDLQGRSITFYAAEMVPCSNTSGSAQGCITLTSCDTLRGPKSYSNHGTIWAQDKLSSPQPGLYFIPDPPRAQQVADKDIESLGSFSGEH